MKKGGMPGCMKKKKRESELEKKREERAKKNERSKNNREWGKSGG